MGRDRQSASKYILTLPSALQATKLYPSAELMGPEVDDEALYAVIAEEEQTHQK